MSDRWAASLPPDRSAEALRLWLEPGIEVCMAGERLWMRGDRWSDDIDRQLRSMLGADRFAVDEAGLITPAARVLPVATAPAGPWTPLTKWFQLAAPPRQFSARSHSRVRLRLEPTVREAPCNMVVVPLKTWCDYAQLAPAVRLKQWSFAASGDGQVVVRGAPLPPLPGAHYVETGGIAVPAGWSWSPAVDATVLREVIGAESGDILLLNALSNMDASYDVIAADEFVQATRSAVRLTARGIAC